MKLKFLAIASAFSVLILNSVATFAASSTGNDHGYFGPPKEIVDGRVRFPGFGDVPSNVVCLDGQTLRTTIPAGTVHGCDKRGMIDNGLGYKIPGCVTPHVISSAMNLEAPLEYRGPVCVEYGFKDNGLGYPIRACLRHEEGLIRQELTYTVRIYQGSDYIHSNPIFETRSIAQCK